jgi:hypothetical protein
MDWSISLWSEMSFELVIGKDAANLFDTIHSFENFKIDITFGVKVVMGEAIFANDGRSNILVMDAHVLEDGHVGDQNNL